MENNELQHWGIKGMQWGRRRFQNTDGSLTPAGKARYADDSDDDSPAYKKQYDAVRKEIAAERAAKRRNEAENNQEPAVEQTTSKKSKNIAKKVAILAAAGATVYGLSKYQKYRYRDSVVNRMLENMKEYTINDINSKSEKGRRIYDRLLT